MTDTTSKTYRIDRSLWSTYLNPRYMTKNAEGKKQYARLAKGEDSIFEKEQSEFAKPDRIVINSEFYSTDDALEIEWLENHPDFGKKIFEYDPAAEHKAKMKVISGTTETMMAILALDETQARGIGYRKYGRSALKQDINELKGMLVASANENFAEINGLLNEKTENDFALIGVAMAKDIIYEGRGGNDVRFKDTDEVIVSVRANERPIDAVASFLQTGAGKEIKKIIFQKLSPVVVEEIIENETKGTRGRPASK